MIFFNKLIYNMFVYKHFNLIKKNYNDINYIVMIKVIFAKLN